MSRCPLMKSWATRLSQAACSSSSCQWRPCPPRACCFLSTATKPPRFQVTLGAAGRGTSCTGPPGPGARGWLLAQGHSRARPARAREVPRFEAGAQAALPKNPPATVLRPLKPRLGSAPRLGLGGRVTGTQRRHGDRRSRRVWRVRRNDAACERACLRVCARMGPGCVHLKSLLAWDSTTVQSA
jgi:hypothetical protein